MSRYKATPELIELCVAVQAFVALRKRIPFTPDRAMVPLMEQITEAADNLEKAWGAVARA